MVFLYDTKTYTYDDLLNAVNGSNTYFPLYRTTDLFSFFANFVKALAISQPLTLLDSDINASEIDGVSEREINVAKKIGTKVYSDLDELVTSIQKSQSLITIFTSGTTGQPKKVVHSIETLTRAVRIGQKYSGQIWAFAYNPTHMAGLQVFFQAFENKNTLVNVFGKSREEVYDLIAEKRITHISATPTFYRLLLPVEKQFESVIRITLGGEKSDQRLYDALQKVFPQARINNVYASTEAGSLFASKGDLFQFPDAIKDKFMVINDELLIHKSLLGYSEGLDINDDYYHSGDLIEWIDKENGLFRFRSRKNELINVGGYKVNPSEVEDSIMAMEGVCQALVYGKQNSILGNVLCADVLLEDGYSLSELDIRKRLSIQLQDFKIPRRIKFVKKLSMTRTGKLKRI